MSEVQPANVGQIAKNSVLISVLTIISLLTGLGLDVLIAARFGLGHETDAFFLAYAIPLFLVSISMSSIQQVFVPLFSHARVHSGKQNADRLVSILLNYGAVLGIAVAIIGVVGSPLFMRLMGPAVSGRTYDLAVNLSMILFLIVAPIIFTNVSRAQLNCQEHFAVFPLAMSAQNLCAILVTVFGPVEWGVGSVAVGYAIGYLLQGLICVGAMSAFGWRYYPTLSLRHEGVKEALRLVWAPMLGGGLQHGAFLLQRFMASFLPVGSVAALGYTTKLHSAFLLVFADSTVTALLPGLSRAASAMDLRELKRLAGAGFRLSLMNMLPLTVGAGVLGVPMVAVLLQRGQFTSADTILVGSLLAIYALGWPFAAALRAFYAPFLAWRDSLTPTLFGVIQLAVNVILSAVLIQSIGVLGLGVAWAAAAAWGFLQSFVVLRRKIGRLDGGLGTYTLRICTAAGAMAIATWLALLGMSGIISGSDTVSKMALFMIPAAAGFIAFSATAVALRLNEVIWFITSALRKVGIMHRSTGEAPAENEQPAVD